MTDPSFEILVTAQPWYRKPDLWLLIALAVLQVVQGVLDAAPDYGVVVPGVVKLLAYGASLAAIAVKGLLSLYAPETLTGVQRLDRSTSRAATALRERTGA